MTCGLPVTARALARLQRESEPQPQEDLMAKMCPIDGCKAKQGLCTHDKLMILMGVMLVAFAGLRWGLHVI